MPLQLPHFPGTQYAGKGGILAQSAGFLVIGTQDVANFFQRALQDFAPFRVTTQQGRGVCVPVGPAVQIVAGYAEQIRLLAQSRGYAAAQLQADFVCRLMPHTAKIAGLPVEVNAASERRSA